MILILLGQGLYQDLHLNQVLSSQSSTPNTVYLRSDLDVSCDTSSAEKISDELSDSNPESNNKQMRATIPKIRS